MQKNLIIFFTICFTVFTVLGVAVFISERQIESDERITQYIATHENNDKVAQEKCIKNVRQQFTDDYIGYAYAAYSEAESYEPGEQYAEIKNALFPKGGISTEEFEERRDEYAFLILASPNSKNYAELIDYANKDLEKAIDLCIRRNN